MIIKNSLYHAGPVLRGEEHIGSLSWRKAGMGGYHKLLWKRYVAELTGMEKYGRLEKLKR